MAMSDQCSTCGGVLGACSCSPGRGFLRDAYDAALERSRQLRLQELHTQTIDRMMKRYRESQIPKMGPGVHIVAAHCQAFLPYELMSAKEQAIFDELAHPPALVRPTRSCSLCGSQVVPTPMESRPAAGPTRWDLEIKNPIEDMQKFWQGQLGIPAKGVR